MKVTPWPREHWKTHFHFYLIYKICLTGFVKLLQLIQNCGQSCKADHLTLYRTFQQKHKQRNEFILYLGGTRCCPTCPRMLHRCSQEYLSSVVKTRLDSPLVSVHDGYAKRTETWRRRALLWSWTQRQSWFCRHPAGEDQHTPQLFLFMDLCILVNRRTVRLLGEMFPPVQSWCHWSLGPPAVCAQAVRTNTEYLSCRHH